MPNDPVQKSFVNLSLIGGVNKKTDSHQLQNGQLLTADNVVFTAVDGQVTKRYGFASVTPAGAPFQGGPFKALGVRDNTEPLILGANTLNKYNVAKNLSTTLTTPTQGRVNVQQVVGSSGQASTPWPPSHASCATDGSSYALLTWEEPNGTGSLCYYGIQDLATGNWIIKPTPLTIYYPTLTGADGLVYSNGAAHAPKACYANGFFYFSYIWCGQNFTNSVMKYAAFVVLTCIDITNLAAGATNVGQTFQIGGTPTNAIYSSPTLLRYDFDIAGPFGGNSYPRFIIAAHDLSTSTTTGFYSGGLQGTFFAFGNTAVVNRSFSTVANGPIAVRVQNDAASPFTVAYPDGVVQLDVNLNQTNGYGLTSQVNTANPVDVLPSGNNTFAVIITENNTTQSFAQLNYNNPNSVAAFSPHAFGTINWNSPLTTSYVQVLSRLFQKAAEPLMYCWIGAAGPTTDTIYNSAYLVEFNLSTNSSQTICRTMYLTNQHITGGDTLFPCNVLHVPNTGKYVTYLTAITEKIASTDFHAFGTLSRVEFDFQPPRNVQIVSLPTGGVMIAGSYPLYYDGATVNEAGFSSAPDGNAMSQSINPNPAPKFAVTSITIGPSNYQYYFNQTLVGGTSTVTLSGYIEYYYVICLVRRDAYGNVNRSAPSPVITVPISNPGGGDGTGLYNNVTNQTYSYGGYVTFPPMTYNGGGNVMIEYYRSTQNTPGTFYFLGQVPNGSNFVDQKPDGVTRPNANTSITKYRTVYTNSNELPNDPPPPIWHAVSSESRVYCIPADNRNLIWYSKQFSPGRTVEWSAGLTISEGLNSGQFMGLAILDSNLIIFKVDQVLYTWGNGPDNTGANGAFAPFTRIASDVGCVDPGSITVIPDGVVFKSRRGIELLTRSLQIQYIGSAIEPLANSMGPIASVVTIPNFTETRFIPSTAGNPVLCYDYDGKRWSTFSNMAAVQAASIFGTYWFISADGSLVNQETPGSYTDNGTPIVMTLETPEIPVGAAGAQGWGRAYRMALLGDFYNDFALTVQFAYDHSTVYTDAVTFSTAIGLINGDKVFQFRTSRLPRQVMQTMRLRIQDSGTSGQACAISNIALEVGSKNGLAKLADQKTL